MLLQGCSFDLTKRGELYEKLRDYAAAIECYEKIRLKDKQNPDIPIRIAEIYTKFGKYKEAKEELELAKQLLEKTDPDYGYVCYRLGYCYYEMGDTKNAVNELKRSMELNSNIPKAHLYLGIIYLKEGEYDLAIKEFNTLLEKEDTPQAHYYLAMGYWGQGGSQDLTLALDELKVAEGMETDEEWRQRYQEMQAKIKSMLDKIEKKIVSLHLGKSIFPAIYGYYSHHPIGTVVLQNKSDETMYNVEIDVDVKGYGIFPQDLHFQDIPPRRQEHIDLFAAFTNEILSASFTPSQPVEIILRYDIVNVKGERETKKESIERTVLLHDKNAMVWEEPYSGMVSAFVTPTDNVVEDFTRKVISTYRPFNNAIEIYNALNLCGVKYSSDASPSVDNIDRIFYPRETMELKRGDCDDLSVLYASCLESVGIDTAFVLAPRHIFIMFDTGVHLSNAPDLFLGSDWYVQMKGNRHAWLPIEMTILGQADKGFFDAWKEGVRQYKSLVARGELQGIIYTHDAWKDFKPVAFPNPGTLPQVPAGDQLYSVYGDVISKIHSERESNLRKRIETYIREIEILPQNAALHNSLGIAYAKFGITFGRSDELSKAEEHFRKAMLLENWLPAPYTNLGNIYLLGSENEEDLKKAEAKYDEAIQRGEVECVYLNKMILYIIEGNRQKAAESLAKVLTFYTPEEMQTILGMSVEDLGIAQKGEISTDNKVRSLIQSLLNKLSNLKLGKDAEKTEQPATSERVEKTAPLEAREAKDTLAELESILDSIVPKKPDEPISPGGVRGAIAAQLEELPLLLYWSEVRID